MKNIIITILILMLHSCSKQDFTSCDGTEKDVLIKSGKFYGDVKLNDSNNHWLIYDYTGSLVSFINDKGFQLDYLQSGYYYNDK